MAIYTERSKKYAKGIIGFATGSLGRYREFDQCLNQLEVPPDSPIFQAMGNNVAFNYNRVVREMLTGDYQWVWLIDDDHVFAPDVLVNLLERNVDIVTAFCLKREKPYSPVLYEAETFVNPEYKALDINYFRGMSGLYKLKDNQVNGSAGMLIQRRVCVIMNDPWFENGRLEPDKNSWDLWFSQKARIACFDRYLDLDNRIGHIGHFAIWPKNENGRWRVNITNA